MALALTLGAAAAAAGQEPEKEKPIFGMEERPVLRFGDALRLEPTVKFDAMIWTSDFGPEEPAVSFDRRRVGLQGRLFKVLAFELERELADNEQPWRDAFAELRHWRGFRVKAGRFKIPFGEERLTSIANLDFVTRSLASEHLTSGRDLGVEINGRLFGRGLSYRAGAFQHDGDVARRGTDVPGERTFAGTLTIAPFAKASAEALQEVEIGGGATFGEVEEGLNGLRARTVSGYEAVAPHFVSGRRLRLGGHAAFSYGRVAVRGEMLQARDERKGQGLAGEDLPDVRARGSYISAMLTVLGELKGSAPVRGLNAGGPGALQIAARAEWLGFSSVGGTGQALRNPRAPNIRPNDIHSTTLGVNWYPVRFVKLQFNIVRETLGDPERRPDPLRPTMFSRVFRIQFAL